jgi:hypothetical protein
LCSQCPFPPLCSRFHFDTAARNHIFLWHWSHAHSFILTLPPGRMLFFFCFAAEKGALDLLGQMVPSPIYLSFYLSIHLSISSIYLSICMSISISVYLCIYLFIYLWTLALPHSGWLTPLELTHSSVYTSVNFAAEQDPSHQIGETRWSLPPLHDIVEGCNGPPRPDGLLQVTW